MLFVVIIAAALAQTGGKVEIIKGGAKKKRPAVVAPADTSQADAIAARQRELDAKQKDLDEKNEKLDAKEKALETKQKDLDAREEEERQRKEDEQKRRVEQQKAADKLSRDTNTAVGHISDALGGN